MAMFEWDERQLAGRGLEALLTEYHASADPVRRERLSRFFSHCMPTENNDPAHHWEVGFVSMEDLMASGQVEVLRPASSPPLPLTPPTPDLDILIVFLPDATVFPNQTVVSRGAFLSDLIRHMDFSWFQTGQGYDFDNLHDVNKSTERARLHVQEGRLVLPDLRPYFLFHAHSGSISFGHFILDTLSQLVAYDHLCQRYGFKLMPIIVNNQAVKLRWPGMVWLFEALVGPLDDAIHVETGAMVQVERLYTTNRMMQLGYNGVAQESLRYLQRQIFTSFEPTLGFRGPKRVYVSRSDAGYAPRDPQNLDEVEVLLRAAGFVTVIISDLSPQEAFDMLHGAEIIVGVHGSGLAYHIYAQKPGTVIELTYPGYDWDIILASAAALGHATKRIPCQGRDVDLAALRAALDEAAGRSGA